MSAKNRDNKNRWRNITEAGCFVITVSVIRTAAHTTEERFHFGKKPSRRRDKRCQRCQCF